MRVSLLSTLYSWFGANGSGMPSRKLVEHACMFKQSAIGVLPTFCSERAGTTYRPTESVLWLRSRFGVAVSSDDVCVRVHTSSCVERRGPGVAPLPCASSAALELMKNSVPPAEVLKFAAGAVAGHSVKPELPLSRPWVSIWVTAMLGAPDASAALDMA